MRYKNIQTGLSKPNRLVGPDLEHRQKTGVSQTRKRLNRMLQTLIDIEAMAQKSTRKQ